MMDGEAMLLLRFGGYVLNIFICLFVALRYRRHIALIGWAVYFAVIALALLLRYLGAFDLYLSIVDTLLLPLLYINALLMLWSLLRSERRK